MSPRESIQNTSYEPIRQNYESVRNLMRSIGPVYMGREFSDSETRQITTRYSLAQDHISAQAKGDINEFITHLGQNGNKVSGAIHSDRMTSPVSTDKSATVRNGRVYESIDMLRLRNQEIERTLDSRYFSGLTNTRRILKDISDREDTDPILRLKWELVRSALERRKDIITRGEESAVKNMHLYNTLEREVGKAGSNPELSKRAGEILKKILGTDKDQLVTYSLYTHP